MGKVLNDYNIYAGLGGGYGGATYKGTLRNVTEKEAYDCAYQMASEEYDSYSDVGGYSWEEMLEDANGDEDAAREIENENRESWIDYWAVQVDEDEDFDEEYDEVWELN